MANKKSNGEKEPVTTSIKAVGYIRVSTTEQANEGVSLEAQETALCAYCAMRSMELVAVARDAGVSGGKPIASRPGGAKLLELLGDNGAGAVVAYKMDRLFRDAADCLATTKDWLDAGVALHLVDLGGQSIDSASPMGRFFLTIMAACAEWERNIIRERTRVAMAHLKATGYRVGGLPYGLQAASDGRLVANPAEAAVLATARHLRNEGRSLRAIRDFLEHGGYKPRGKAWHLTSVAKMVAENRSVQLFLQSTERP